jgi:AcrR family transcriptional regulator
MKETKQEQGNELSTEDKIKEAARKLFTQKGFDAVRTRDIAEEAGINLALLNYYFRSKQKLFDIIMLENFRKFLHIILGKVLDESLTIDEKIQKVVEVYIDMLTQNPDLPLFVLNEIRGNPTKIAEEINSEAAPMRALFFKQIQAGSGDGKIAPMEPLHFVANLVGLTVFPFVAKPILQRVTGVNDDEFNRYMQERKKLVPIWIKAIMNSEKEAEREAISFKL